MQLSPKPTRRMRGQRGLSLVELMVGVVVALFVVAAASLLMSTQLNDNRRLLLETQVQQDLRATTDIIARELRRSSYWAAFASGTPEPGSGTVVGNPGRALGFVSASNTVNYRYSRAPGTSAFGFKLEDGVIKSCQGEPNVDGLCAGTYQDLTDRRTVTITAFTVTQERPSSTSNDEALLLPCPNLCSNGSTDCWPRVSVREFLITVTGRAVSDPTVIRTLSLGVRVRNDRIELSSEAAPNQACPAS